MFIKVEWGKLKYLLHGGVVRIKWVISLLPEILQGFKVIRITYCKIETTPANKSQPMREQVGNKYKYLYS